MHEALLLALAEFVPWASSERAMAGGVAGLTLELAAASWELPETRVPMSTAAFVRIGLPPEAPIQVVPHEDGVRGQLDDTRGDRRGGGVDGQDQHAVEPTVTSRR